MSAAEDILMPSGASAAAASPASITIATQRGELVVPVTTERGHAALPAAALERMLPVTASLNGGWAQVAFAGQPYRFLLGAPAFLEGGRLVPLAGGAYVVRDSLFLPLQWLTGHIAQRFREGYRYDPLAARFEEAGMAPVVRTVSAPPARTNAAAAAPAPARAPNAWGLRTAHAVVLDPGHGGTDPGNPGLFLPRGIQEKHINLAISNRVRLELERRGVRVIMTRTTDTLISFEDRARACRRDCALFVSIHVNSLPRRPGFDRVTGIETYYLGEPQTEHARRVAEMENEAMRYEIGYQPGQLDDLALILRSLETNEFLRESALLADLVQSKAAAIHPGRNRGVAQNRFLVLLMARRPAILVETGFSTNREDAAFLASAQGQQRLAVAIADGITEYLRRYEDKTNAQAAR